MLLRVSGELRGQELDVHAVVDDKAADESGVAHADALLAFADAVVGLHDDALPELRAALIERVGPEAFVDAAAVAGNFQRMVRIADSTGIPLDDFMRERTGELRDELGLARFGSSANTPQA